LDFGLAKITPPHSHGSSGAISDVTVGMTGELTSPGTALGTIAYMSPEQVRGKPLDTRTDLFSFGVVLYEMVTGVAPFQGDTSGVIFDAILNRAPTGPVRLNPNMPRQLEEIINKALEKDCSLRYQHAAEITADLKRLLRDTNSGMVSAYSGEVSTPAAVSKAVEVPQTRSSRKALWGVVAGLAAIALLAFGFFSGRITHLGSGSAPAQPSPPVVTTAEAKTKPVAEVTTPPPTPVATKPSPAVVPSPAVGPSGATIKPSKPKDEVASAESPAEEADIPPAANDPAAASAGTAELTLHDGARGRDIPIKIYYPEHPSGSLPLIIFSPGYGGNREGYEYLGRGWTSAGYIVILSTHAGNDNVAIGNNGMRGVEDPARAYENQIQRTADVHFLISSLKETEKKIPAIKGKLDRKRIGVGGHSMGGGTALLVAGATAAASGGALKAFRDDHVRAVVAMSPPGPDKGAFTDHSWDQIRVPVMTMNGTRDRGIGNEPPEWRTEAFKHMPAGDKYQVVVNGANHLAFATGQRSHVCILKETTAFWDTYLKGQSKPIKPFGACDVISK